MATLYAMTGFEWGRGLWLGTTGTIATDAETSAFLGAECGGGKFAKGSGADNRLMVTSSAQSLVNKKGGGATKVGGVYQTHQDYGAQLSCLGTFTAFEVAYAINVVMPTSDAYHLGQSTFRFIHNAKSYVLKINNTKAIMFIDTTNSNSLISSGVETDIKLLADNTWTIINIQAFEDSGNLYIRMLVNGKCIVWTVGSITTSNFTSLSLCSGCAVGYYGSVDNLCVWTLSSGNISTILLDPANPNNFETQIRQYPLLNTASGGQCTFHQEASGTWSPYPATSTVDAVLTDGNNSSYAVFDSTAPYSKVGIGLNSTNVASIPQESFIPGNLVGVGMHLWNVSDDNAETIEWSAKSALASSGYTTYPFSSFSVPFSAGTVAGVINTQGMISSMAAITPTAVTSIPDDLIMLVGKA